jgi:hypothetical protein
MSKIGLKGVASPIARVNGLLSVMYFPFYIELMGYYESPRYKSLEH